jgi:hypothetical protein
MMNIAFSGYRIVPDTRMAKAMPSEKYTKTMEALQNLVASHRDKLESGPLQNTDVDITFRTMNSRTFADNLDKPSSDTGLFASATYRVNNQPEADEYTVFASQHVPYTLRELGAFALYSLLTSPWQHLKELPEVLTHAVKAPFVKPETAQEFIRRFVAEIQQTAAGQTRQGS